MAKRMMLWLPLLLVACSSPEPGPVESDRPTARDPAAAAPAEGETCVLGTLTNEGVECPAMQTLKGEVYTLVGDLQSHQTGDLVCTCGRKVELSTCMQGTTLEVTRIGSPALCP